MSDDNYYQKIIQNEGNSINDNDPAPITPLPYNIPNNQSIFENNTPNSAQIPVNNSITQYPQNNQYATPYEVNNQNNNFNPYYSSQGVIYYPQQNSNQPYLNTNNNFEGIKNISELSTKYISQPSENIFIIKIRCTDSCVGVFFWYLILFSFIAIGLFAQIYIMVIFCGIMGSIPLLGLFCWVFSYKITLGDNSITIKENKCCRYSKRTYLPGEIRGFLNLPNSIMFLDNNGNKKYIGAQDYTSEEINYFVYKLNIHIETKMRIK